MAYETMYNRNKHPDAKFCICNGITGYTYHVGRTKMSSRWGKKPRRPAGTRHMPMPTSVRCRDCEKIVPMRVAIGGR